MPATDKIYHDCAARHPDGARLLINFAKNKK